MIGDHFSITLIQTSEGVVWDLRSEYPNGGSVRIERNTAHSFAAAAYIASRRLDEWTSGRS